MSRLQFAAVLLCGAIVRAIALPAGGSTDIDIWKAWTEHASHDGVGGMYGSDRVAVDYPPLALYELGAAGHLHRAWSAGRFPDDRRLNVAIKLPSLAGDVAIAWLLFAFVKRCIDERTARWSAAAYWLNPAVLLDGSILGYLDLQYLFPAIAAVIAAAIELPVLAGACIGAAVMTKAQGVFIAPAVALGIWSIGPAERRLRRISLAAAAASAVAIACTAEVVVAGELRHMLAAFRGLARHDMLSGEACNLWWLVGYFSSARDSMPAHIVTITQFEALGYPNPRVLGAVLTSIAAAWSLWRTRSVRDVWLLAALAAFLVHAYGTLSAQVHENHLFAAVPLLLVAGAGRSAFRPLAIALSAIVALNLNLFYGLGGGMTPRYAIPRGLTVVDATLALAVANCAALWWHARILHRQCSTEPA